MGLSASQARFLQLTARNSNVEYQAQQISFERLQWAEKLENAAVKYQEKTSNRKMVFSFNNGEGIANVDVTYGNYKNYMNQQLEGLTTSQDKIYLVSSTGKKIVVASEAERDAMIEAHSKYTPMSQVNKDDLGESYEISTAIDDSGNFVEYLVKREFNTNDFLIADDLDDADNFQNAIANGIYFFAKRGENTVTNKMEFKTQSWDVIGGGAIAEVYDKADDAAAEAEFEATQNRIQNIDKKLELQLSNLETERSAIQKEMDSVTKVIDENIDSTFKTFS